MLCICMSVVSASGMLFDAVAQRFSGWLSGHSCIGCLNRHYGDILQGKSRRFEDSRHKLLVSYIIILSVPQHTLNNVDQVYEFGQTR